MWGEKGEIVLYVDGNRDLLGGLINRLWLLCDQQSEALLDDKSMSAVRVLRGESGRVGRCCGQVMLGRSFLGGERRVK